MTDRHLCDEYTEMRFREAYERPVPYGWQECEDCTVHAGDLFDGACEECAVFCEGCDQLHHPDSMEDCDGLPLCGECMEKYAC